MRNYLVLFLSFSLWLTSSSALADQDFQSHVDFEKYSVHFNVFNSTFIPPEVAATYGIKRSKYESLINVSLSLRGEYGAIPAKVMGTVTDLMQQQKKLKFIEIAEKTATYYIAPVRISGEDLVRFHLSITPEGESTPLDVKFERKIYSDS